MEKISYNFKLVIDNTVCLSIFVFVTGKYRRLDFHLQSLALGITLGMPVTQRGTGSLLYPGY